MQTQSKAELLYQPTYFPHIAHRADALHDGAEDKGAIIMRIKATKPSPELERNAGLRKKCP